MGLLYIEIYRIVLVVFLLIALIGCILGLTYFKQHCLYFLPLPQGQGELRPTFRVLGVLATGLGRSEGIMLSAGRPACSASAIIFIGRSIWLKNCL